MPRATRLAQLQSLLTDGATHRAADLAARLGVSERTIFRDMDTLRLSGVPVEGRRGAGYRAEAPLTLPPMAISETELEALHLGLAVISQADDPELAPAAAALADRLDALLPEETSPPAALAAHPFDHLARAVAHVPAFRAAMRARQKLSLTIDGVGHVLRPLALRHWGRVWIALGWSETDGDFRRIRLDQVSALRALPALFVDEPGRRLADFEARETMTSPGTMPGARTYRP